jgi:hypothetical protein
MTTHAEKELTPADVARALEEFGPAEWDEVRALLWQKKTLKVPSVLWSLVDREHWPEEPPPSPEGDRMAREALKRMRGVLPITDPELGRWLAESPELSVYGGV